VFSQLWQGCKWHEYCIRPHLCTTVRLKVTIKYIKL
jgi:hypothetical protein